MDLNRTILCGILYVVINTTSHSIQINLLKQVSRHLEGGIMTAKELKKFFKEHLVPSKLYKIGKERDGRVCLTKEGNFWEVYFMDHKEKIGLMKFTDENSACLKMKDELRKIMETIYEITWMPTKATKA